MQSNLRRRNKISHDLLDEKQQKNMKMQHML